ncbi:MAG: STM3941 family protein [Phycisphaerae bacterium]
MTEHDAYHPRPADAVEFYPERKKMIFYAALCGLFVALGFWLIRLEDKTALLGGWLTIFLFTGFGITCLLIGLLQRTRLVVSDEGVELTGSGAGLIEWSEVKQIQISEVRDTQFISLLLYDPEAYRARLPLTRRVLAGIDENLTGAHVSLPGAGLNASREEILELMVERLVKYRRSHGLNAEWEDPGDGPAGKDEPADDEEWET